MKKIFILIFLILTLIYQAGKAEENSDCPKWINELHLKIIKTFKTEVSISKVKLPDNLEEGKCFVFCLKGNGILKNIPDPFETMEKMFSADGWKYIPRYQADGHASSSFAYEKGSCFCNTYVNIDSSCNDEERGYVPSKFWFEIYCREK